MKVPDWQRLELTEGILREATADNSKIVLWVPREREGKHQYWERIGNVAHAEFIVVPGIGATPASAVRTRYARQGILGQVWRKFHKDGEVTWLLPNGVTAEQCGERRTDILLVWAEDEASALDESRLRSCWPQSNRLEKIGKNLYLVGGIADRTAGPVGVAETETPIAAAQRLLDKARASGDLPLQASALADLGAIHLHAGKAEQAIEALGEALAIARQLGDRSRASDVLGNLGLVTLTSGYPDKAFEIFAQGLDLARQAGDRFAEKMSLERVGLAHAQRNDSVKAVESFSQALAIARELGHRKHQADLLWYLAIQHAEQGQRDMALASGEAALDIMKRMNNPEAAWFAQHLERYRQGQAGESLGGESPAAGQSESPLGGSIVAGLWAPVSQHTQDKVAQGPGLLRMAISAARSMAKFIGTGFKVTPDSVVQQRRKTCSTCEHHTGVRCRLCGCFTNAKTRLAHEECPIGKWSGIG